MCNSVMPGWTLQAFFSSGSTWIPSTALKLADVIHQDASSVRVEDTKKTRLFPRCCPMFLMRCLCLGTLRTATRMDPRMPAGDLQSLVTKFEQVVFWDVCILRGKRSTHSLPESTWLSQLWILMNFQAYVDSVNDIYQHWPLKFWLWRVDMKLCRQWKWAWLPGQRFVSLWSAPPLRQKMWGDDKNCLPATFYACMFYHDFYHLRSYWLSQNAFILWQVQRGSRSTFGIFVGEARFSWRRWKIPACPKMNHRLLRTSRMWRLKLVLTWR